jgi:hypothetical protein
VNETIRLNSFTAFNLAFPKAWIKIKGRERERERERERYRRGELSLGWIALLYIKMFYCGTLAIYAPKHLRCISIWT